MTELIKAIFARFLSDDGGPLRELLGRDGEMTGMYLGEAPESAPSPRIIFFVPADGMTDPSAPTEKDTTLERTPVQFSVFASTQTKVMEIMDKLKDLYDRWSGPFGPEEQRTGSIIYGRRHGPGWFVKDPEEGFDGHVQYTFTYWVS